MGLVEIFKECLMMFGIKSISVLYFKKLTYLIVEFFLKIGHDFKTLVIAWPTDCFKFVVIFKFSSLVNLSMTRKS